MDEQVPYRLSEPVQLTSAAVFDSPHSGRDYPAALQNRSRLDPVRLRASEDALVDELFHSAPEFGAPLLCATAPRAWVDLNRGPHELDPALIDGARTSGINQRIAAGLGVVPRIVSEGTPIYDGKISLAEAEQRIQSVHTPYHARLDFLLKRAQHTFGHAILFDCHSMPSEALRAAPRVRGQLPDIVLGDRFGASAAREITQATQEAFESAGFLVARNAPFAGGYIIQRYGRPARGLHAVQIEIDRGLYLDQSNIAASGNFDSVRNRLMDVTRQLTGINPRPIAVAAE
ncbi:MAG: N-formylglutamate amidohydrolase [Pseudomonadota bacterium]